MKSPTRFEGKPRLVFLTDAIDGGGAERIALAQARAVDPEKFDKVLIITRKCDLSQLDGSDQNGLRVICLNRERRWDHRAILRLWREFKQADIIHAHKEGGIMHAVLWGRWHRRSQIVAQLHTKVSELRPPYSYVLPLACKITDQLIMVSQHDCKEHRAAWHLDSAKINVVYNGVEIDSFGNIDRDSARSRLGLQQLTKIIGIVGRIDRHKGHEFFLEAAAILKRNFGEPIGFLIIGRAPEEADRLNLEAQARKLGIAEEVVFLGQRLDVPMILPALDVFVLSSVVECLPVALLEAMATGLPVVATTVGGVPEVVVDGESGLLVPPRDPQALAAAVTRLWENPDLARRLGEAARERVRARFSLAAMTKGLEQVYERLLSR